MEIQFFLIILFILDVNEAPKPPKAGAVDVVAPNPGVLNENAEVAAGAPKPPKPPPNPENPAVARNKKKNIFHIRIRAMYGLWKLDHFTYMFELFRIRMALTIVHRMCQNHHLGHLRDRLRAERRTHQLMQRALRMYLLALSPQNRQTMRSELLVESG